MVLPKIEVLFAKRGKRCEAGKRNRRLPYTQKFKSKHFTVYEYTNMVFLNAISISAHKTLAWPSSSAAK